MSSGAERLDTRVQDHLQPGEDLRAAVWASRPDGRASTGVTRADMSPFRFRRPVSDSPSARRGIHGPPRSAAAGLGEHLRNVSDPRVLALTDRRVLLLAKRIGSWRDVFRPGTDPAAPLDVRWECPREELESAAEEGGRLRLTFTDRSAVSLLTPADQLQSFLAAG